MFHRRRLKQGFTLIELLVSSSRLMACSRSFSIGLNFLTIVVGLSDAYTPKFKLTSAEANPDTIYVNNNNSIYRISLYSFKLIIGLERVPILPLCNVIVRQVPNLNKNHLRNSLLIVPLRREGLSGP